MARKRMIDPSLWTDDGLVELTPRQQLLYIGLFSNADDDGRLKGSPTHIRLILPIVYAGVSLEEIADDLDAVLAVMTRLVRYSVDGKHYLAFDNYRVWQSIDRPSPSKLPPPPEPSASPRPPLDEPSSPARPQVNRREEKLREEKESTTTSRVVVAPAEPVAPAAPAAERPVQPNPRPKEREKSWTEKHPLFAPLVAIPSIGRPAGDRWSLYTKMLQMLDELGATPEQVPICAANYPSVMGVKADGTAIPLTITALVNNWALCLNASPAPPPEKPTRFSANRIDSNLAVQRLKAAMNGGSDHAEPGVTPARARPVPQLVDPSVP